MLEQLDLERVLVLDIETVSQQQDFEGLNDSWKELWKLKAANLKGADQQTPEELYSRAGIYAEFGKIVCISVGIFRAFGDGFQFRVKSYFSHDEKELLSEFAELLNGSFDNNRYLLAAHNGKEFDFPYMSRRMTIHGMKLPLLLDTPGKKPWEVPHIDSMELWKFGDYKSFTSLKLLAQVFDIPTPKDDIDGSQVGQVYWEENNLDRIRIYCQKDVITVAQLLLRFQGKPLLSEEAIIFADQENA